MIIDAHAHLYGKNLTPRAWVEAFVNYGSAISSRTPDYVKQRIEEDWFDETGDLLIEDMNQAGIDKAVIMAIDFGLYSGTDDGISLARRYEIYHAAVRRHPDRLILFGGVDPRRPDAAKFLEHAVKEWDVRGFKLWCLGVYPNESCCYRLYEKCAELGLPAVIHTGQEIAPARSEPTKPILVDQPANDFPEITFVLAHAGMAWWEEAASLAWHHPNVYLDIAYWQMKYLINPEFFAQQLRSLMSLAGKGKVFFGSDWPALRGVSRVKHDKWIEILQRLPEEAPGGVKFEPQEIELLLGEAAKGVLKLG